MKSKDLKNSILQMAVEGKLVPQNPDDEPASVLLDRIREEKHRLIAEGKAKFPKGGESIIYTASDGSPYEKRVDAKGRVLSDKSITDEVPFELPEGWCWARLETACQTVVDCPHSTPVYLVEESRYGAVDTNCIDDNWKQTAIRYVSSATYESRTKKYKPEVGDIVFSREGSIGRSLILNRKNVCLGQRVMLLSCEPTLLLNYYCQLALSSPYAWSLYRAANVGTGVKHINVSMVKSLLLPLPPLAEQRRIAERVSELMPLVDAYGELEDAREELDAALPDRLRRSVLQEAVRGRLAPQDPSDEPASELLGRVRAERRALAAEGKMRLPKGGDSVIFTASDGRRYEKRVDAKGRESEPVCIEDEIPFEIPESWAWARLGTAFSMQAGKNIKASDISDNKSVEAPYPCFGGNGIRGFVSKPNVSGDHPLIGRQGALCGNVQRAAGAFYATEHAVVVTTFASTNVTWACMFLKALNLNQYATATAQPGLAVSKLCEVLIPFPPLMEQARIVTVLETTLDLFTSQ